MTTQKQSLINKAQNIDFNNHELLVKEEEELAQRGEVLIFNRDELNDRERRFLFYTSLPYSFSHNTELFEYSSIKYSLPYNHYSIDWFWMPPYTCSECENLNSDNKVLPSGNLNPKYFIVMDKYNEGDRQIDRGFVLNKYTSYLRKALFAADMYLDSWFTTLLKCKTNKQPTESQLMNCQINIKREIKMLDPDKIIFIGKDTDNLVFLGDYKEQHNIYHPKEFIDKGKSYFEYAKHIKGEITVWK